MAANGMSLALVTSGRSLQSQNFGFLICEGLWRSSYNAPFLNLESTHFPRHLPSSYHLACYFTEQWEFPHLLGFHFCPGFQSYLVL